jgi:hypothetical protein
MRKLIFVVCLLLAAPVSAQYRAEFDASADHNAQEHGAQVVSKYEVLVYSVKDPNTIISTIDIGKPTPVNDDRIVFNVDVQMKLIPAGDYLARVRAVGPGGVAVSTASDPFPLQPRAPAGWPAQLKPTIGRAPSQLPRAPRPPGGQ